MPYKFLLILPAYSVLSLSLIFAIIVKTCYTVAMNLQKAKVKYYYASIPLLGCVLDTFFLLLSSPDHETCTSEDVRLETHRVDAKNLVAAQRHFQQLQQIKIPWSINALDLYWIQIHKHHSIHQYIFVWSCMMILSTINAWEKIIIKFIVYKILDPPQIWTQCWVRDAIVHAE